MKKEYICPETELILVNTEYLLDTDSDGLDNDFGAKENNTFEDEANLWGGAVHHRDLWDE